MTRLLLLALLAACVVAAQEPVRIDLGGAWKVIVGEDRPEFASPDFDDHAWPVAAVPFGSRRPIPNMSQGWLRRRVALPASSGERPLALTVGYLRGIQEIFINGQRIGASSDTLADAELPQPRSYPIPPSAMKPGEMLIAIRMRTPQVLMTHWGMADQGPWLLTDLAGTPWEAGRHALENRAVTTALNLMLAPVAFVIALLSVWAWWSDRRREELIWFALGACVFTLVEGYGWIMLTPGARPFNADGFPLGLLVTELGKPLMAEFVLAAVAYRSRWLRFALWAGWFTFPAAYVLGSATVTIVVLSICWCAILSVAAVAFRAWQSRRQTLPRETWVFWLVLLAQPLVYLDFAVSRLLGTQSLEVVAPPHLGPYVFGFPPMATVFLAAAMLVIMLRRSRADQVEKQRLTVEMEGARVLQQLLLPAASTTTPRFELAAVYQPALEVGGDFHWNRVEPDGSLLVVVGDVSGKGLKAAMLVSVGIGILRNEKSPSPAAILTALNDGLAGHTGGGFITCCCARFDAHGGVTVANAGHPPPYVDGRELDLEPGLPLGVVRGTAYAETQAIGSRFTFISDGVLEAENAKRELFGFERSREVSGKSAAEIAEAAQAWGQNDDITVVTVWRSA